MKKLIIAAAMLILFAAPARAAEWRTAVEETYEDGAGSLTYLTYRDYDPATVGVVTSCPNDDASEYNICGVEYVGINYGGIDEGGVRANITDYVRDGDKLRVSFDYRSSWFGIEPFIEVLAPDGSVSQYRFGGADPVGVWTHYQSGEVGPVSVPDGASVRFVIMDATGFWHFNALKIERLPAETGEFFSDAALKVNGAPAGNIADGKITVSGNVRSAADVYAALYKNGALAGAKKCAADGAFSIDIENEGADTLKVFAWNDMEPASKPLVFTADVPAEPETIKEKYADDFLIGTVYNRKNLSGRDKTFLLRHFNTITAENIMKPDYVQPWQGVFLWDDTDAMMDFAKSNKLTVIGHALVWHQQTPAWFTQGTAAQVENNMKTHINTVLGRYKGRIKGWDVVNEAIRDDIWGWPQSWDEYIRTDDANSGSPWYRAMGKDYIYKAFVYARAADPDAELYYNDYNLDSPGKREAAALLVKYLNDRYKSEYGTDRNLVDAIGMQSHYNLDTNVDNVRESINRFREIGVKVNISELDVCLKAVSDNGTGDTGSGAELTPYLEAKQASKYAQLMAVYHANADIIDRVTFWGYDDASSWRAAMYPTLFNADFSPKQAFYAVMDPTPFR